MKKIIEKEFYSENETHAIVMGLVNNDGNGRFTDVANRNYHVGDSDFNMVLSTNSLSTTAGNSISQTAKSISENAESISETEKSISESVESISESADSISESAKNISETAAFICYE